jgi:hypothetical protein
MLMGFFLVLAPLAPGFWSVSERVEEHDDEVTVSVGSSTRTEARQLPTPPPRDPSYRVHLPHAARAARPPVAQARQARRIRRRMRRLIHFNDDDDGGDGDDPDPDQR